MSIARKQFAEIPFGPVIGNSGRNASTLGWSLEKRQRASLLCRFVGPAPSNFRLPYCHGCFGSGRMFFAKGSSSACASRWYCWNSAVLVAENSPCAFDTISDTWRPYEIALSTAGCVAAIRDNSSCGCLAEYALVRNSLILCKGQFTVTTCQFSSASSAMLPSALVVRPKSASSPTFCAVANCSGIGVLITAPWKSYEGNFTVQIGYLGVCAAEHF
jgi:hypothetical protein